MNMCCFYVLLLGVGCSRVIWLLFLVFLLDLFLILLVISFLGVVVGLVLGLLVLIISMLLLGRV